MRKSFDPSYPVQGNSKKYLCYREAWKRINCAIEEDFFIEAVAIEESIITDRILAYIRDRNRKKSMRVRYPKKEELNQALGLWTEVQPTCELREEVKAWKEQRNEAIHEIVKAENINTFLEKAKVAAQLGKELARKVDTWQRMQKAEE